MKKVRQSFTFYYPWSLEGSMDSGRQLFSVKSVSDASEGIFHKFGSSLQPSRQHNQVLCHKLCVLSCLSRLKTIYSTDLWQLTNHRHGKGQLLNNSCIRSQRICISLYCRKLLGSEDCETR